MNGSFFTYIFYGAILFALYKLFQGLGFVKTGKEVKADAQATATARGAEQTEDKTLKKIPSTLNESTALVLADKLYSAMKGAGTNKAAVSDVFFKIKNDSDFIMLKKAFGTRDGESMLQWLTGDLSRKHRDDINKLLAKRKVTYRI